MPTLATIYNIRHQKFIPVKPYASVVFGLFRDGRQHKVYYPHLDLNALQARVKTRSGLTSGQGFARILLSRTLGPNARQHAVSRDASNAEAIKENGCDHRAKESCILPIEP